MTDRRFATALVTILLLTLGSGSFFIGSMMSENALDSTGGQVVRMATLLFGTIGSLSGSAQVFQMIRTGSADDVSVTFLALLGASMVAWLSYGITLNDWVMITVNTLGASIILTTVVVAVRLQRRSARLSRLTVT